MTFDDDIVRLHLVVGTKTIRCKALGLEWPPPKFLHLSQTGVTVLEEAEVEALDEADRRYVMERMGMSQLTDEDREAMSHVVRGAEYEYVRTEKR